MKLSSSLTLSLLSAVASSTVVVQATKTVARSQLDELSIIFYNGVNLTGGSFSPPVLSPGSCSDLPCRWLDRPESVLIGPGYTCTLFALVGCAGPGNQFNGTVIVLPVDSNPPLFQATESFSCNKEIDT